MFKSLSVFLCVSSVIIGSYASLVPFIDKCKWNDKACLVTSSQKAIKHMAPGIPELGVFSLDPLVLGDVKVEEGELKIFFKDMVLVGASKAKVVNVERNLDKSYLLFEAETPFHIRGTYTATGKVAFIPIEGDGPFEVKSDKILISVKVGITLVDGPDGKKHWQTGKFEHTVDYKEKAFIKLENLFNGDKEKAEPINVLLDQSWKELIVPLGEPMVAEACSKIITAFQALIHKVPAEDLEIL